MSCWVGSIVLSGIKIYAGFLGLCIVLACAAKVTSWLWRWIAPPHPRGET